MLVPDPPGLTRRLCGRRSALATLIGGAVFAQQAQGGTLPGPPQHPILIVDGKITNSNDGSVAKFDRTILESIGLASIETRTPWFNGIARFEGVPMDRLMQAVGSQGTNVVATALNDYQCKIPISDFTRFGVLLALKRDGKYMSVRDKGPLFIIYPFDANPELQNSTYTSRCAWQVQRITVI
jgi:hypothetical protein